MLDPPKVAVTVVVALVIGYGVGCDGCGDDVAT
jgi:hypothetical protein